MDRTKLSDDSSTESDSSGMKGANHSVHLVFPFIKKKKILDSAVLEKTVKEEAPGMLLNDKFDSLMMTAKSHLRALKHFRTLHRITPSKIRRYANKKEIPLSTLRKWILKGVLPRLYSRIQQAISNKQTAYTLLDKLDTYQCEKEVRKKLNAMEMDDSIDLWPSNDKQWKHLEAYFRFLELLKKGTLLQDIARIVRIHKNTIQSWSKGVLPLPVLVVIKSKSERARRLCKRHPIVLSDFTRNALYAEGLNQLESWIENQIPGLMKHPEFSSLINQTAKYLSLVKSIDTKDKIRISELESVSNRLRIGMTTARRWILEGNAPLLMHLIDISLRNQRKGIILENKAPISRELNLQKRMLSLYISPHLKTHRNFDFLYNQSNEYFRYLNLLKSGHLNSDISRITGLSERTLFDWSRGRLPLLVHFLAEVPSSKPSDGNYWLPLNIQGRRFTEFIEVPGKIRNYQDLSTVLDRLENASSFKTESDCDSQNRAFMYVLGMILADGYIAPRSKTSFSLRLGLSTNYDWSIGLLEKMQKYLEGYGLNGSFEFRDEVVEFRTALSPFYVWLKEVVFGLGVDSSKTYDSASIDWLLESPKEARVSFVQGLADGDGHAASPGVHPRAGIASLANAGFIKELLSSLGVDSSAYSGRVSIFRKKALMKAAELPLFRHAKSRLENLKNIKRTLNGGE